MNFSLTSTTPISTTSATSPLPLLPLLPRASTLALILVASAFAASPLASAQVTALITEGQAVPGNPSLIVNTITPTSTNFNNRSVDGPSFNAVGGLVLSISTGTTANNDGQWHLWGRTNASSSYGIFRSASDASPNGDFRSYSPANGISDSGVLSYIGRVSVATSGAGLTSALGRDNTTVATGSTSLNAPAGVAAWGIGFSPRGTPNGTTWFRASYATTGTTPNAAGLFTTTNGSTITSAIRSGDAISSTAGAIAVAQNASASPTNFKLSIDGSRYIGGFTTTGSATAALVSNGQALNFADGTRIQPGQFISTSIGGNGTESLSSDGINTGSPTSVSNNGNWIAQLDSNNAAAPRLLVVNGTVVERSTNSQLAVDINDSGDYAYIRRSAGQNSPNFLFVNGVQVLSSGDLVNAIGALNSAVTLFSSVSANGVLSIGERNPDDTVPIFFTGSTNGNFSLFTFNAPTNTIIPEPTTLAVLASASFLMLRRRRSSLAR